MRLCNDIENRQSKVAETRRGGEVEEGSHQEELCQGQSRPASRFKVGSLPPSRLLCSLSSPLLVLASLLPQVPLSPPELSKLPRWRERSTRLTLCKPRASTRSGACLRATRPQLRNHRTRPAFHFRSAKLSSRKSNPSQLPSLGLASPSLQQCWRRSPPQPRRRLRVRRGRGKEPSLRQDRQAPQGGR